ncbi:MAG: ATP-binding protein [Myxococcales bacterium]|nr:ATP-binding protein [Myxococcales bacterium]
MKLSRFERKIVAAIAAVALVPMVGAIVLGERALSEAYGVGVNPQVRDGLEQRLELYREHFVTLREAANQQADAIAFDHRLVDALSEGDLTTARARLREQLQRYPAVHRVQLRGGMGRDVLLVERELPPEEPVRELPLDRVLPGSVRATITVAAPLRPFHEYQRAGELTEVFSRLEHDSELVSNVYLVVYIAFLLSVIALALGVGIVLSRRVTRRVAILAEATEKVGAGDLTVQVPTDARDEIGDLTHAFNAMVRDIRESRGRIEYLQRIGAWQEFARRLAHEIKNPLTPIQLAIQELHRGYEGDDAEHRKRLDDAHAIIEEEVATLRRLTGEFSAFARLPEASLEAADLGDFLAEAARSLEGIPEQYAAEGHDVRVDCVRASEALPVRIDAMMLKRGVDNLVRNAVQALVGSGHGGHVRVRVVREGDAAVLEVADDGPGIAERDRARIFDPYYTTKAEGTGLGLAIVKKVVLEHGGEIECEAGDLGGVAFLIRLPVDEQVPERKKAK